MFADDVLALAENGGSLTYYSFPKNLLRDFVRRFFPAGVVEATYHLPEYAESRERLYRAVRRMMRAFLVLRPCRCVLSGNFGYLEQQELFRFFRDSGRLGAVLFKEGIALQNMQAPSSLAKVFAGKRFLADLALFYNEEIAAMMAGAGVPGLEPSKCRPVGVPRMDRYHGRKSLPDKSLVLFSFYPEDKFKYFVPDAGVRQGLDGRAAEFHRAVVAFAVDHPEWSVVVKTKKSPHYLDYVSDLAPGGDRRFPARQPDDHGPKPPRASCWRTPRRSSGTTPPPWSSLWPWGAGPSCRSFPTCSRTIRGRCSLPTGPWSSSGKSPAPWAICWRKAATVRAMTGCWTPFWPGPCTGATDRLPDGSRPSCPMP